MIKNKSYHQLYHSWRSMHQRCYTKSMPTFHRYGGRGIKVCKRWHDFDLFVEDMGERPEGMTIERKDNDKNYCPENVVWATWSAQFNNRSTTVKITHNGVTKSITEWAKEAIVDYGTFRDRLVNHKWPIEKALTTPLVNEKSISYKGMKLSKYDWDRQLGFRVGTVSSRLYKGWSIEKALTTPLNLSYSRC